MWQQCDQVLVHQSAVAAARRPEIDGSIDSHSCRRILQHAFYVSVASVATQHSCIFPIPVGDWKAASTSIRKICLAQMLGEPEQTNADGNIKSSPQKSTTNKHSGDQRRLPLSFVPPHGKNTASCEHVKDYLDGSNSNNYHWAHTTFAVTPTFECFKYKWAGSSCMTCNKRTIFQHICLECMYRGCRSHIRQHCKLERHALAMEFRFGQVYCSPCGDYMYDMELYKIAHKSKMQGRNIRRRLLDVDSWFPFIDDDYLKEHNASHAYHVVNSDVGLRGLINMTNTCYINCIIQVLIHTPLLRDFLLSQRHVCNRDRRRREFCLMCEMYGVFQIYYDGSMVPLALANFLYLMWSKLKIFQSILQQDAHELFITLAYEMHLDCEYNSVIMDVGDSDNEMKNYNYEMPLSSTLTSVNFTHPDCNSLENGKLPTTPSPVAPPEKSPNVDESKDVLTCDNEINTAPDTKFQDDDAVTPKKCEIKTEDTVDAAKSEITAAGDLKNDTCDDTEPSTNNSEQATTKPDSSNAIADQNLNDDHLETSIIKILFGGKLMSELECTQCRTTSIKFEQIWDYSLELRSQRPDRNPPYSLHDCLEWFTRKEMIDAQCSQCESKTATLQLTIDVLPIVLCFHLKRMITIPVNNSNKTTTYTSHKVKGNISFPEVLDMTEYLSRTSDRSPFPSDHRYKLFAVVDHVGETACGGHYTASIRQVNDKWFYCDDANITPTSLHQVLNCQGYMLFYYKVSLEFH